MGTTGINYLLENPIRIEVEEKTLERCRELNEQFRRDMHYAKNGFEGMRVINRYGYELFRIIHRQR